MYAVRIWIIIIRLHNWKLGFINYWKHRNNLYAKLFMSIDKSKTISLSNKLCYCEDMKIMVQANSSATCSN